MKNSAHFEIIVINIINDFKRFAFSFSHPWTKMSSFLYIFIVFFFLSTLFNFMLCNFHPASIFYCLNLNV